MDKPRQSTLNRQILELAIPALGALVAEPLMTMADSAMVGHLGTEQLAGMAVGTIILNLFVGMCIFLAYTTTALTSRRLGAGDKKGALRGGIDGMWLAARTGAIGRRSPTGFPLWCLPRCFRVRRHLLAGGSTRPHFHAYGHGCHRHPARHAQHSHAVRCGHTRRPGKRLFERHPNLRG